MPEGEVSLPRHTFAEYHSALIEPWDGPTAVTYTDGRIVGTILDRNGLRPARYVVLDNGFVILSSEVGAVAYDKARVIQKGKLVPGEIFCVDTTRGAVMNDYEVTALFHSTRKPYDRWVLENLISLDEIVSRRAGHREAGGAAHEHQQTMSRGQRQPARSLAGAAAIELRLFSEGIVVVLRPMVLHGQEPVGSMGTTPPPPP